MINSSLEQIIEAEGEILELPRGFSMWPMLINQRDTIVLKKPRFPLKTHDVVLYRRPDKCVLHRFLYKKGDVLVIRGDNCRENELDITEERIFGMLKGFYKGDKYIDCETNKGYKLYVWFWRYTYYLREFFIKPVYHFALRIGGKILRILKIKK